MLIDGQKYATSSAQADGIEEQFKTKPKENINTTTMATPTKKSVCYCGYKDILLKYAIHEKTKNKEKTERKDL